jgi:sarcosine oxidase subunit beta
MSSAVRVVVIGAGVIGSSIALALARDSYDVTIVDRAPGPGMGSTSASSAIVRFHYSTYEGVATAWEAKHGWQDWPRYIGTGDEAGLAHYVPTGVLVLDTPGYDSAHVVALYDEIGIPYDVLTPDALRERFPFLSSDRFFPPRALDDPAFWTEPGGELGGFYTPEGGFVDDPGLAAHNLWNAATAAGARSAFRSQVTGIARRAEGVRGVELASGEVIDADVVVNAAGPHSSAINRLADVLSDFAVTTRPMRQEVHAVAGPSELEGGIGPAVGDGDLGTYFRFAPGGDVLVGSQEPACDPLEWLDDPDTAEIRPTVAGFERQTTRLARRMPTITVPHRPTGLAGVYDVSDDWIPIYDKTSLPGFFVAIGTSGNQFKNAPAVGPLMATLISATMAGHDHDRVPVVWSAPYTSAAIDLSHYSRRRAPNAESSNSVLG